MGRDTVRVACMDMGGEVMSKTVGASIKPCLWVYRLCFNGPLRIVGPVSNIRDARAAIKARHGMDSLPTHVGLRRATL